MSKRSQVWEEVKELVRQGKTPVIEFPKATKIVDPKRPIGRPAKPPGAPRFYGWTMTSPSGSVMRCRAPRCRKHLRKGALRIVCSDQCENLLREYCEITLAVLNGTMDPRNYPPWMRVKSQRYPSSKRTAQRMAR